jgi:hypothetical protein
MNLASSSDQLTGANMKILSVLTLFFALLSSSCHWIQGGVPVEQKTEKISALLDRFHSAAANAKFDEYFGCFGDDAIFIGTDPTERWTLDQFKAYVAPHFSQGKGWTYTAVSRHISFPPQSESVAYFDEDLKSESYGTARGSGVLVKEPKGWKIVQYNLSFPIPNALAKKMTDEMKTFAAQSIPQ